jgi:hypothetical protein
MKNKNDSIKWKVFIVKDIFSISTGASIPQRDMKFGNIPRITAAENKNGISGWFKEPKKIDNYRKNKNFISVSFLGSVFYHPYESSLDMKIHALVPLRKTLNKYTGNFIVIMLKQSIAKVFYGNQLSSSDLPNKKILLPVNNKSQPNWDFMERYMKNIEQKLIEKYQKYIIERKNIERGENENGELITADCWKEFKFTDIFTIAGGFYNKKPAQSIDGKISFIGATDSSNGVTGFCHIEDVENSPRLGFGKNETIDKKIFRRNCIVVTNDGSVGHAYYQPHDFTCSHSVNILRLKDKSLNRYLALFLIQLIERQGTSFEYARKWRPKRMKKSALFLPITKQNKPDWNFMEQYMKNIEQKFIEKYLKYLSLKKY